MPTARNRGRPRKTDLSLSSAILTAAVQRFAHAGFAETSLRDIAGDARVDVALIAYQFGAKLPLWEKVIETVGGALLDHLAGIEAANAARSAADRLNLALGGLLDFLVADPVVPQFILRDLSHDADREAWIREKITLPLFENLRALADAAAQGGVAPASHRAFAIANFIYAAAGAVARRNQLASVIPELEHDDAFRAALDATLLRPVQSHD